MFLLRTHQPLPKHSVTQLIGHMVHISKIQKTASTFVWTRVLPQKRTQWEKAGCSVPSSMYWLVQEFLLPHQSILGHGRGNLSTPAIEGRSGRPGHSAGLVTRQSGATLEWYLTDYRDTLQGTMELGSWTPLLKRTHPPLDSEILRYPHGNTMSTTDLRRSPQS